MWVSYRHLRFCLPLDAEVTYKDSTGTKVDAEIFSDLVGQGNVMWTVFSNDEFSDSFLNITGASDSSCSSSASTIILDEVPNKRQRFEDTSDAVFAKQVFCTFCSHPVWPLLLDSPANTNTLDLSSVYLREGFGNGKLQ